MVDISPLVPILCIIATPFALITTTIVLGVRQEKKLKKWKDAHQTPFPEDHIKQIAEAMCKADGVNPMEDGWKRYAPNARQFLAAQHTYRRIS